MIVSWGLVYTAFSDLFVTGVYWLLIVMVVTDFVTGNAKAIVTKDVSSSVGIKGLIKHSVVVMMVTIVGVICILLDANTVVYAFTLFYVFEYIISIIENLDSIGVKFPEPMAKMLRQWQDKNKNRWGE